MNLLKIILASPMMPLGVIFAESDVSTEDNGATVASIVFVVVFLFVYSSVLGKKKDARTKTGYKDNKVPMHFILRFIISLFLAFVAVVIVTAVNA